jgi:cyclic-di-GMP-binding protein
MAIQSSPQAGTSTLFFNDARECKDWLRGISMHSVAMAQQNVLDGLRLLNRSTTISPTDRLTCLELMRDKVAFLLAEQRTRYVGKTIPLMHGDVAAWNISRSLLAEMEAGFTRCLDDAKSESAPLAQHGALVIQRIMRYIGLQMLIAGFVYKRFDGALWERLHRLWAMADARGLATKKVKDSIGTTEGYSSVKQAYTAVLLGQAANVYELTPREIDFVDGVLKRFGGKVDVMHEGMPAAIGGQAIVDLDSRLGLQFVARADAAPNIRLFEFEELRKSLRRRLKKLAEGEEPRTMELPPEWGAKEAHDQLARLILLWCDGGATRPPGTVPSETHAQLTFGLPQIHFFLSGALFEQPDVPREMTRQEMNDIKMFGKVSEATIRARYAEYNYGTESWGIVEETRNAYRLMRPANSSYGLAIGRVLGMKIGKQDSFYLGTVRELAEEIDGSIFATVSMMPGKPEATSVRGPDNQQKAGSFVQGFRLAPMPALKIPETLVVPAGVAQLGRSIDIFHAGHGSPKQVRVVEYVERGVDFDRVTIK